MGETRQSATTCSVAGGYLGEDLSFERVSQSRLGAEGKRGADLHAGGAGRAREAQPGRGGVGAGQPERQLEPGDGGEVDLVEVVVDGLAEVVEVARPTRGGVVSAGAGAFDDEAVRAGGRVGGQAGGQVVGGDDGQESGPAQRG